MHTRNENARLDEAVRCSLERGMESGELEPVSRFRSDGERYWVVSAIENGSHRLGYFTDIRPDDGSRGWVYVWVTGRRPGFA